MCLTKDGHWGGKKAKKKQLQVTKMQAQIRNEGAQGLNWLSL